MSFRGGRGGSFGGGSSRGGRGGFSSGGSNRYQDARGSDEVMPLGTFMHASEGDMFCKSVNEKIPYFNAPVYLENKTQIGKVDEILGPINEVFFTVKCQEGVVASSFKANDKVFVGTDKLLPIDRFLPKPKGAKVKKSAGAGGRGGAPSRGGRGSFNALLGARRTFPGTGYSLSTNFPNSSSPQQFGLELELMGLDPELPPELIQMIPDLIG